MAMFGILIAFAILLISSYITYWIFDNWGFAMAWGISTVITVVVNFVKNVSDLNGITIFSAIVVGMISSLISTGLEYFVYNRTNSFWGFLVGCILMGIAVVVILVLVGVALGMTFSQNGILAS